MPTIWAIYVRRRPDEPWRLQAMSVLSAERARALAEREHARAGVRDAQYLVREFESPTSAPWTLEAA
jgi:hypothetical protein